MIRHINNDALQPALGGGFSQVLWVVVLASPVQVALVGWVVWRGWQFT
jgi:hypothetical protein